MSATKKFVFLMAAPLLAITVAVTVLFFTGHKGAAWVVSVPGTTLVMLLNLLYVTIFDSRGRWPGQPWHVRLTNVLTFMR